VGPAQARLALGAPLLPGAGAVLRVFVLRVFVLRVFDLCVFVLRIFYLRIFYLRIFAVSRRHALFNQDRPSAIASIGGIAGVGTDRSAGNVGSTESVVLSQQR
jgi:hypothetical protein